MANAHPKARGVGHYERHPRVQGATSPWRTDRVSLRARDHAEPSRRPAFRCVNRSCKAEVTGAALFCDLHLWTFDNPTLRSAPILLGVVQ